MPEPSPELSAVARLFADVPQFKALGLELLDLGEHRCTMVMTQRPELYGDAERAILHGGVVTTLLDSVCGMAVYAGVEPGTTMATLDLRIDYLRPTRAGERLFGTAEAYRRTRNVVFVSGSAYQDDASQPVARCTASFMVGSVGFAPRAEAP